MDTTHRPAWPGYLTPARDGIVLVGDALARLRELPDNSISSVVTDPPYGLAELPADKVAETLAAWTGTDRGAMPSGRGFMGKSWDSFVPPPALWDEVYRVLKPGGHVLAFAGSRTVDLMGISLRLARFEIRDTIHWTFGTGFPKSLNVGKAIDKAAGVSGGRGPMKRGGERLLNQAPDGSRDGRGTWGNETGRDAYTYVPGADEAQEWSGFGTALKPSHEPIIVARKPLGGTVAACVLEHGTGALNIDACRVRSDTPVQVAAGTLGGYHGSADGHYTKGTGAEFHTQGRWPANTILTHAATCERTGERTVRGAKPSPGVAYGAHTDTAGNDVYGAGLSSATPNKAPRGDETVAAFECAPGCPVAVLDEQSGNRKTGNGSVHVGPNDSIGTFRTKARVTRCHDDNGGGASRFFTVTEWDPIADADPFLYVAKPSKRERNAGLETCACGQAANSPRVWEDEDQPAQHQADTERSPQPDTDASGTPTNSAHEWNTSSSGNKPTAPSPNATTSTTATTTSSTTGSPTSPASTSSPTSGSIPAASSETGSGGSRAASAASSSPSTQSTGTSAAKAGRSTAGAVPATSPASSKRNGFGALGCKRCGALKGGHPTVKPVALMRHLVRLVTPPRGVVLDPFAGSGTTLVAATLEGFPFVGVELTEEYVPIIAGRVAWAVEQVEEAPEISTEDTPAIAPPVAAAGQLGFFA